MKIEAKENLFISLISDTTFKYLFKNEDTKDFLISIIKDKFGIDLNDYFLTSEEDNTGTKVKDYHMDIVFKHKEKNEYIIVEANSNISYVEAVETKAKQYLYRKVSHGYDKGETYINPPKAKLIMFNNYKNPKNNSLTTDTYYLQSKETKTILDDIYIHEIYLPIYHEMCYTKLDEVNKKLWMFGSTSFDEYKDIHDENEKIVKELERLSMNDKFVDEYDYENVQRKLVNSVRIEGYDNGVIVGYENGVKQEKIDIAKKMLSKTTDIEYIAEITDLSIQEINSLKENC